MRDACGFYEIRLIRRAKQWHDAIIATHAWPVASAASPGIPDSLGSPF
jgi:hypothetical protein